MKAAAGLERLGGVASARALLRLTNRRQIRRALKQRTIVRLARGRYALPTAEIARAAAAQLSGVVCLRSAAAHHGWALKTQPDLPEVAVNPRRHLAPERREGLRVVWMNVAADDVVAGVTTPLKTVLDCARHLPFDEALAIADSALRSGAVSRAELDAIDVRGAGAAAVRRVLAHADARAANPFESVLRALCLEEGLDVVPQHPIDLSTGTVRPDLASLARRLVLEADSWSFHASRKAHRRDCARYNLFVIHGWRVLRFTWEQVMHDQAYVRWVLRLVADECVAQDEVGHAARISA
jgi:very-short-patch-repair endonuclease